MASGADIALPDTGVPVELDRIYASLEDLTVALGPNGVNKDGTLDHTLAAARNAFEGNGALGNEMIRNLSEAAVTFGEGSGDLFDTVSSLAQFTEVLADQRRRRPGLHAGPRRGLRGAGRRARRAVRRAGLGRRRGRHRRDVRPRQPQGAGHRRREADPGPEDDQLREGQHRHGADRGAGRDRQPGPGLRHAVRLDRLADRRPAATSRTSTASCARSSQQSGMPAVSKDLACTIFEQIVESGVPSKAAVRQGGRGRPRPRRRRPAPTATRGPPRSRTTTRPTTTATLDGLFGGAS